MFAGWLSFWDGKTELNGGGGWQRLGVSLNLLALIQEREATGVRESVKKWEKDSDFT